MLNSTLSDKGFLRIKDWWWSKAALLMGMVYLFAAWFNIPFKNFVSLALLSIVTISGFASVGYLFNDFFDRKKDTLAGKKNFLAGKPTWLIIQYFLLGFVLLFFPWKYLPFTYVSAWLIAVELLLFLIYSLPPFRLKEKGMAGIIIDALYAHALPVALAVYTFSLAAGKQILPVQFLLLIGWQTCSGIRNILLHQHDDVLSDAKAGNKNRVAKMTEPVFFSAVKYLIMAEVIMSVLFFAGLSQQNIFFLLCVAVIVLWSLIVLLKFRRQGMKNFTNTYWKHFPNNVYEKWIPPANLLILSLVDLRFIGILFLHVLFFNHEFYHETIKRGYPVVRYTWVSVIRIPSRQFLSVIINYPIYYLFLIFGVDLKKENVSAVDYLKKEKRAQIMSGGKNIFVFVVCGAHEHLDTLHYSLQALKNRSGNEIIIVTDSARNEIPVMHSNILDVKTPDHLNHHQASIYLKTGLHKFLPPVNNYCYLDTDVVAVDEKVDDIFNHFHTPITFANDHCLMDKFSPSAINCGCISKFDKWATELRELFKKYKHLTRPAEDLVKKEKLLQYFDEIKKHKLKHAFIALRFMLSPRKFKLHSDAVLDKQKQTWFDLQGRAILYEKEDNAITAIESTTAYRCDVANHHRWTIEGKDVFDCRCNHLQEQIFKTFGIYISVPKWQHWNGGVFLFNQRSHAFLESWHEKTLKIFENSEWKTRDQGALIATVWENGLQNHTTLPIEFNLIADYNHLTMEHKGGLCFDVNEQVKNIQPHFVHVYHHWADKNWDVWKAVESRTGIVTESKAFS